MKKLTNRSCSRYEDKLKYGLSEKCLKAVERNLDWFGLFWFGNFQSKFVYRHQGKRGGKACEPLMAGAVLLTFFQLPSCMEQEPLGMMTTVHKYVGSIACLSCYF